MKATYFIFLSSLILLVSCSNETRNNMIISQIDNLFHQGKYKEAKISVDSFIHLNPKNELAWTLKGHIEESLDNDSVAQLAYEKALTINPKIEQALTGLGIVARKNGEYDKAAGYYFKAIKVNPDYAPAYSSLVTIELKRKNLENAVKLGEKAYLLKNQDPVIAANLSVAYHYFGDTLNRNHYYNVAKSLKYRNLDALQQIFNGEITIFDE